MKLSCFPYRLSLSLDDKLLRRLDRFFLSSSAQKVLICGLILLIYWPTIDGDFVFDDHEAVLNNADVRWQDWSWDFFFQPFRNDFWGTPIRSKSSHKSYRPLTVWSFRLNDLFFGTSPRSFHVCNILLHCLVACNVMDVLTALGSHLVQHRGKNPAQFSPFVASVIFAAHPIHVETVAGIVGRAELLSAVFYLWSIHHYMANKENTARKCVVSAGLAFAAMFCKEQGITALAVIMAVEAIRFIHRTKSEANETPCQKHKKKDNTLLNIILLSSLSVLAVGVRLWVMGPNSERPFTAADNPAAFMNSSLFRAVNHAYIWCLNGLLLVWPQWLCFDWSMGCVPLITSLTDYRLLITLLCLFTVGVLLIYALIMGKRLFLVAGALAFCPFLPSSNIFFPVGFVIADRVLYLPSIGFSLLVAVGYQKLINMKQIKDHATVGLWVLVLAFCLKGQMRGRDWKNDFALCSSGLKICPQNAKIHYNLGRIIADSGMTSDAVNRYEEAVRLWPSYSRAMNNLANILKDQGNLSQAEMLLHRAVEESSDFATAWMNLGITQAAQRKYEASERSYMTALRLRPRYGDCYYNLGNLYIEQGHWTLAMRHWRNATMINPKHSQAWINMIVLADNLQDFDLAVKIGQEALLNVRVDKGVHSTLGSVYGKMDQYQRSEHHFKSALAVDPENADVLSNLGVLYHKWRKLDKAELLYREALAVDPNHVSTQKNLAKLITIKAS